VRQRLNLLDHFEARWKLRDIAEAGVRKAMYILDSKEKTEPFTDTLLDDWSSNESAFRKIQVGGGFSEVAYQGDGGAGTIYGAMDEERKINLNSVKAPLVLTRLFQYAAGLKKDKAHDIAVSIFDWMDEDDIPFEGGAEANYYKQLKPSYAPKNKPFDVLEELLLVKGVTPEIYQKVLPFLTLTSTGQVNLNTASKTVLKAMGFEDQLAGKVLSFRAGRDKKNNTSDDQAFQSLGAAVDQMSQFAGLDDGEKGNFQSFVNSGEFSVASTHFSIQSIGHLPQKKEALMIRCVVKRYGGIQRWQEKYGYFEPFKPPVKSKKTSSVPAASDLPGKEASKEEGEGGGSKSKVL
jgi:type II secretory pathway component PulK